MLFRRKKISDDGVVLEAIEYRDEFTKRTAVTESIMMGGEWLNTEWLARHRALLGMVLCAKTGHVPTRRWWGDTSNPPSMASIHDNIIVWYASDVLIASLENHHCRRVQLRDALSHKL
jgi:hypothetical protein